MKNEEWKMENGETVLLGTIAELQHTPVRFCSAQEAAEFHALGSDKRRRERAATLQLLHGVGRIEHPLLHHPNGAPFLENSTSHISITHSQRHVAIALHPTASVGIDIEDCARNFNNVAARMLNESEQQWCRTAEQRCIAWCAKEAMYKALNRADVDFAAHLAIEQFLPNATSGTLRARYRNASIDRPLSLRYTLANGYAMALLVMKD